MIRARFVKAEPTALGITYTLKGELDKVALHSAVDLQGEECIIKQAVEEAPQQESALLELLKSVINRIEREAYERGLQDAVQGNLLAEEKGEQK